MEREPFSIHPVLQAYIDPLTDEEFRLLEESILAEGVRDPLVVWREENVLVDGHNRKAICDRHGLPYCVVYRSFADIDAAKAWMDLNQLGRRNLTKEKRDEMIRRLAARGVDKKEIAEKTTLSLRRVHEITQCGNRDEVHVNTTSPAAEIEALQRRLEEEKANADRQARELSRALNEAQRRAKELEAKVPVPEVREVKVFKTPPEVQERLAALEQENRVLEERLAGTEKSVAEKQRIEQEIRSLEQRRGKLRDEVAKARTEASEVQISSTFEDAVRFIEREKFVCDRLLELAEKGMLSLDQMDMAEGAVKNIIIAASGILEALRKLKSEGGGLRAL